MQVRISTEAARELEEAAAWYESEEPGLGDRLVDAFDHAIRLLKEPNPPLVPITGKASELGAKRLMLHRFPFSLVIVPGRDAITVIAFAHHARQPGYWRNRLPS